MKRTIKTIKSYEINLIGNTRGEVSEKHTRKTVRRPFPTLVPILADPTEAIYPAVAPPHVVHFTLNIVTTFVNNLNQVLQKNIDLRSSLSP